MFLPPFFPLYLFFVPKDSSYIAKNFATKNFAIWRTLLNLEQQLAFQVWYEYHQGVKEEAVVETSVRHIVQAHDFDYSRLWESMNKTNRSVLLKLATGNNMPMENPEMPTSTVFSALKRLVNAGILIKNGKYLFDDPFFKLWIQALR